MALKDPSHFRSHMEAIDIDIYWFNHIYFNIFIYISLCIYIQIYCQFQCLELIRTTVCQCSKMFWFTFFSKTFARKWSFDIIISPGNQNRSFSGCTFIVTSPFFFWITHTHWCTIFNVYVYVYVFVFI